VPKLNSGKFPNFLKKIQKIDGKLEYQFLMFFENTGLINFESPTSDMTK
jgi:hypothetical protein